jgi:hypothetical protein
MSQLFLFKQSININDIEIKTDLNVVCRENYILISHNGNTIIGGNFDGTLRWIKQYGKNNFTEIMAELIKKLKIQIISDRVLMEFDESGETVPDRVWVEYTQSFLM